MPVKFKNLLSRKELITVIVFFLGLIAFFYFTFFTSNYYEGKSPKRFEIEKGETFNDVVERLYNDGVIPIKLILICRIYLRCREKNKGSKVLDSKWFKLSRSP